MRFIVARQFYEMRAFNWLLRRMHAIPISAGNKQDVAAALQQARSELAEGHVVCIFAEGAISRTGVPLAFKRGFEKIIAGLDVPIIPVHLDQVWGSIFSFKDGRFFWKRPERIPYPVTVSFGAPLPANATAWQVRQAVLELGSEAVEHRRKAGDLLHLRFVRSARRHWRRSCLADSTGANLTFGRALAGSIVLARWLRSRLRDDAMVGVLLPASVAGGLANIALLFAQKVPVNLNFTAGPAAMESAIHQCDITTIVTSRTFLAKARIAESEAMVFIEDILESISPARRALTLATCYVLPSIAIRRLYGLRLSDPHSLATVMFTSGSTGVPKGVMLSHHNLMSNVETVLHVLSLSKDDKVMGVPPFFHCFGLTGTLWIPLLSGIGAVYHPNPLDAKSIGRMVETHQATILISTSSFCRAYLKNCTQKEFSSLRHAVVGAEKLTEPVATAFKEKFGLDLLEGYGCTEMSPVVSVNVANVVYGSVSQTGTKAGTVGHPVPGVCARVVDIETGKTLSHDEEGLLLVKGPGRMLGYLKNPDKTAQVLRGDWYVTGDIATIDEDGFIQITDRLAGFSKMGGEMVPHVKIEDAIAAVPGVEACVVAAVSDMRKGERLIAFYTAGGQINPDAIWHSLSRSELPKLWLPRQNDIHYLDELPMLATGKIDLRTVKCLANERAAA